MHDAQKEVETEGSVGWSLNLVFSINFASIESLSKSGL